MTGSKGGSISSFLRTLHTAFQSGCTNLQLHQQCKSVPFSPCPHENLLLFVFLILAILIGVRWNLRVVLIYISLITRDVEHFFIYLLIACMSSSVKCLSSSLAHLLIGFFIFFGVKFCKFFINFGDKCSIWSACGKDFLPLCRLSLHSLDCIPCWEKAF